MKNLPSVMLIMQELQSLKTELSELKNLSIKQTEILNKFGFYVDEEMKSPSAKIAHIEIKSDSKPIENFDHKITVLLKELGIPAHFKGFHFLRYGVKLIYQDANYLAVTKLLYPAIANHFNSTYGKVERAIRYAIEVSWAKHRFHPFYDYYQVKPTNAQFVADLVDHFKLEEEIVSVGSVKMSVEKAMEQNHEALKMLADS